MNKYILLIGIAGVALGSYCAYAGTTATMNVKAKIVHEVNVDNVIPINFALMVNPAEDGGSYTTGETPTSSGGVLLAQSTSTRGSFTAATPSGYDVSKFEIDTSGIKTSSLDSRIKVDNFKITAGNTASNRTTYYVDATLSYTGTNPKATANKAEHDFGTLKITYKP
ncbi:MAG: hypothetical protein IJ689_03235 [Alphaproteobacteria bacterium]|nr:hypothetical protein [Alphaproteobacteria bacterium]